jgi:hypothetical protein
MINPDINKMIDLDTRADLLLGVEYDLDKIIEKHNQQRSVKLGQPVGPREPAFPKPSKDTFRHEQSPKD